MRMRLITTAAALAVLVFGFVAWKRSTEPAVPETQGESAMPGESTMPGTPADSAPMPQAENVPAADPGVVWTVPKAWLTQITSGMRLATYIVPGADAKSDGECAVYYFGPGQGGGVDANLERWAGEFQSHEKQGSRQGEADQMKFAILEVTGTFSGHTMRPGEDSGPRPNWGLIGAIVQGPKGDLFFKLTGPAPTIATATPAFNALLKSLKRK